MNYLKLLIFLICCFVSFSIHSQEKSELKKIIVTGTISDNKSKQPLEFATIAFINTKNSKSIFGGITDAKGAFSIEINAGIYDVRIEFFGFKTLEIKQQKYFNDSALGDFKIDEKVNELKEVVIISEKSTVEIKLDKKVYNVGKDMIVKGGNASDVLQNVPSVAVDGDGTVSLRGNESVKILIDGRPTNAINISDILKNIQADAIEKVEVITNPSARYEAEGGAGILNIILRKGKNQGLNGAVTATTGFPKNNGLNGSINLKSEKFNIFASIGLTDNFSPGNALTNTDYFNPDGSKLKSIYEKTALTRARNGTNFNFGFDWNLTKSLTFSNSLTVRSNYGNNPQNVVLFNVEPSKDFIQYRNNEQAAQNNDNEYTVNFTKKFKKQGQKLTFDGTFSQNIDNDVSTISEILTGSINRNSKEGVKNYQAQNRNLLQTDFVLPISKESQFEFGYRGNFVRLINDYALGVYNSSNVYIANQQFTNVFEYKEKVNALYSQFGTKFNKFSVLIGLRYENSDIDSNFLTTAIYTKKQYDNFFPSVFLTRELSDNTSISLNYSKRIERPRNRFIAPFSGYNSNINIFQGNPNLDPSFTDAIDLGFLTKLDKLSITSSVYFNNTKNPFQFTRRANGDVVGTTPVLVSTPVNLDVEKRYGMEFNLNYNPYKWWRLNGNFNIFESQISGNFSYVLNNTAIRKTEYIDRKAGSWFARVSSKITLPYKIDWQSNAVYTAAQNTAQGQSLATVFINMALSKDIFKEKATITLNVNDLFNGQKMIRQFDLPSISSYTERQGRERQINLSFTYRFNKQKAEKERPSKREEMGGGEY